MIAKTPITELVEKKYIANLSADEDLEILNFNARLTIFINQFGINTKDWKFDVVSQDLDVITSAKEVIFLDDSSDGWHICHSALDGNTKRSDEYNDSVFALRDSGDELTRANILAYR